VGHGSISAAVSDAGPIIHLFEIGCLGHLRIFDTLHIPDAVWSEAVGQNRVPQDDVLGMNTVQRHTLSRSEVTRFIQENGLEHLHDGERECLYLCQQTGVTTLLTDDLSVREAAKHLGLTPVGSLGIVVRAYHLGHISLTDAKRHLADLYDVSSLFVTRAIVELAIERLDQPPNHGSPTLTNAPQ
jgi:predicted nucleic acid-binding protein